MPSKKAVKNTSKTIEAIQKIAYKRGVTIYLDSDNIDNDPNPFTYDEDNKILKIFPENLCEEDRGELIPIIRSYFDTHGLLLSYEQELVGERYDEYEESSPYKDTIEFFAGKIPPSDLDALKMSYYMRTEKENGANIDGHKREIKDRFGVRGAYIANLCNAGYYEGIFTTMCNKLSSERFAQYYELKVGRELAALFVHTGMSMKAMRDSFQEKVASCQKEGVSKFRILGFGKKNVELIREFFLQHDEYDWGIDIQKDLRYEAPSPHSALEYDIELP